MIKKSLPINELETLVLDLLKKAPNCDGAQGVSIEASNENPQTGNWRVTSFNAGDASRDDCESALWAIEDKLLPEYDLI